MLFSANHFHRYTKNLSGTGNLCSFLLQLHSVYGGKFVVKEKKNNPKLAVNIMQEIEKEIMHQECFIPTLSSCFNQLANSEIFAAEFCVLVSLSYKTDSLTDFRARENLRREKRAEEIMRVFEKTEVWWGKKVWSQFVSKCD